METTVIFLLASVVVTTLSLNFGFTNLFGKNRNELVFENKNKMYGAYDLRKTYGKNLGISLFVVLFSVLVLSFAPTIFAGDKNDNEFVTTYETSEMILPPPADDKVEELPPPPPPPVEEVKKSAVQFTTIEVTEEEVLNPPPSDTELDRKNISTETVEGEEGFITPTDVVTPVDLIVKKEVAITFAEEMPKYPEDKMYEDLAKNIVYPEKEKSFQIEGTLFVSFVVEKDGSVTEVQIIREVEEGKGFNSTAINAVKNLKKFSPAKMNGNPVRLRMTIPIKFSLK